MDMPKRCPFEGQHEQDDRVTQQPEFFQPDESDQLARAKRWLAVARCEAQERAR
jgi:hypothetical protein